jgi:heme-degrading monooxygenase HmoA
MAITLQTITIKPADKLWYGQVSAENKTKAQEHDAWVESQPGFVSHTLEDTSENTRTYTIVFDTLENYTSWATSRVARAIFTERSTHNQTNGFSQTSTETIT